MASSFDSRLRSGARRLRWVTWIAIATVVIASLLKAFSGRELFDGGALQLRLVSSEGPRGWIGGVQLFASGLFVWSLWQLSQMLRHAEAGDLFGPAAVRHFRRFALFLFLSTLAAALLPFLVQIAFPPPGGPRAAALLFKSSDAWAIFVSGLLFFIARLFEEAHRLAEDSRSIV